MKINQSKKAYKSKAEPNKSKKVKKFTQTKTKKLKAGGFRLVPAHHGGYK